VPISAILSRSDSKQGVYVLEPDFHRDELVDNGLELGFEVFQRLILFPE